MQGFHALLRARKHLAVQIRKEQTTMTNKASKRILSVTIKHMIDESPDTSWIGEFSDDPKDFAIVNEGARGEYGGEFVDQLPCECGLPASEHKDIPEYIGTDPGTDYEVENPDYDPDTCHEFDRVSIERGREYRYFNSGSIDKSNTDEENRKYALQDYKRMMDLERGNFAFIGIGAEAQVAIPCDNQGNSIVQTLHSGGLWGIESDSGNDYLEEVGKEQLAELKDQLHAIGFTKRAISAAFRNVQHKDA